MITTMAIISIADDPRFKLARSLLLVGGGQCCNDASNNTYEESSSTIITTGDDESSSPQEEAITIFATLLEECITINGETSYSTALCQFEYGNALFRAVVRRCNNDNDCNYYEQVVEEEDRKMGDAATKTTMMNNDKNDKRSSMASAAIKRSAFDHVKKNDEVEIDDSHCNKRVKLENNKQLVTDQSTEYAVADTVDVATTKLFVDNAVNNEDDGNGDVVNEDNRNDDDDDDDDLDLAFEMMDTSLSIFLSLVDDGSGSKANINDTIKDDDNDDDVVDLEEKIAVIQSWVNDQLPRVLRSIGDLYSYRGEYANAVDVYIRAMQYREEAWERLETKTSTSIDELRCKRLLVESYALISETVLSCPAGQDIIAQTTILLSKSNNRLDIAQSYYEMARLGLEDVLCLYGKIMATTSLTMSTSTATATTNHQQEQQQQHHMLMDDMLKNEKEDIGYLVMTIVGIGNTIHSE